MPQKTQIRSRAVPLSRSSLGPFDALMMGAVSIRLSPVSPRESVLFSGKSGLE